MEDRNAMPTEAMDETAGEMLQRLGADAKLWAEEFNKTAKTLGYSDMDEGWLIVWFANAIENTCVTRKCHTALSAALAHPGQVREIGLLEHFRAMQSACTNYLTPEAYVARYPKTQTDWDTTFPMPHKLHSEHEAARSDRRRDKAFIADIIRMLDGPEQREAEAALALPLPVQESEPVGYVTKKMMNGTVVDRRTGEVVS